MQNISLQLDSSGIQVSLNNTVTSLIEQITPELPHTSFVTDLAFIMIIGAVITLAFFKIKQPLIIGYLFAGMLIGPLSPLWSWILPKGAPPSDVLEGVGILSDISALNLFAEIGVILLLFVIGIEFPYAKIKSIGRVAVGVGSIGLFSTLGVLFYTSSALGLGFMDALFISAALSNACFINRSSMRPVNECTFCFLPMGAILRCYDRRPHHNSHLPAFLSRCRVDVRACRARTDHLVILRRSG